jgi:hypothetical protein
LFAVAVLAVLLAASLFSPVAASGGIYIDKVTTNGDTITLFHFTFTYPDGSVHAFDLVGGGSAVTSGDLAPGDYRAIEEVPPGWVVTVRCEGLINVGDVSEFTYIPEGVIITYVAEDTVFCAFTNSPVAPAVGGVVLSLNTLVLVAPWLAVIGLVGCVGIVVLVLRKREK